MKNIIFFTLFLFSIASVAQNWEQMGNFPSGRHHPVSFSINGKGYAVTGTNIFGLMTKDFYEYDPNSDTWTTKTNFPGTARSFGISTVVNGQAYLGFGASSTQYLNDFWRYDPQQDQWTQLASCSCLGRRHPAMIALGNKIYVGLGDGEFGDMKDFWVYNINTNTWTQIADIPGPQRHHPFQFNAGGKVYAGMGHGGNFIFDDWYELDTVTNTWITQSDFPGEARVAGTQFSYDGYGFVLSGDGSDHSTMDTGEMWFYDPNTDSWKQLDPHPGVSRWAPGSFVINNEVYFFGGLNRQNGQYPVSVWKYNLATALSTNEEILWQDTYIYPNPATDWIQISSNLEIEKLSLYTLQGKLLLSEDFMEENLNITQFKQGIYILEMHTNQGQVRREKITITK